MPFSSRFQHWRQRFQGQQPLFFAFLWVSIIPFIGSALLSTFFLRYPEHLRQITENSSFLLLFPVLSLSMGLALLPTTFVAISCGFLLGWKALPLLTAAYLCASAIGYALGLGLDAQKDRQGFLQAFPGLKALLQQRASRMGELVFFVRISPVIPFALSNVLFATLRVGWKPLLLWGFLGMLPRTLLAFSSGYLAADIYKALKGGNAAWEISLLLLFLLVSGWGIIRFFRGSTPQKHL
ncbi:MAG: VTT domain-containing protein [Nitritalea sp.]